MSAPGVGQLHNLFDIEVPALPGAACKLTLDPEKFFPPSGGGRPSAEREAKAMCAVCPVSKECLAWALAHVVHGIWGGTTERERRAWRRRTQGARP